MLTLRRSPTLASAIITGRLALQASGGDGRGAAAPLRSPAPHRAPEAPPRLAAHQPVPRVLRGEDGGTYAVTDVPTGLRRTHSAAEMRRGLPVETDGRSELRLAVEERPSRG